MNEGEACGEARKCFISHLAIPIAVIESNLGRELILGFIRLSRFILKGRHIF